MTEKSQVEVRLLKPADARLYREIRLEALQRSPEAFGSTFEHEGSQSEAYFEEALTKADVFGAFRETDILGMAGYRTQARAKHAHKGMLWGMYVRPATRGTGVAQDLVKAVLDHARERVELIQLTVVSENETAQRLYRSFGFVVYGHEVHALKQNGRYYDELLMAVAFNPS